MRAGEDTTGGAVLRITGDVMGRVVEARGPCGLLSVDDGAQGMSGEGGVQTSTGMAGTMTGDTGGVGIATSCVEAVRGGCMMRRMWAVMEDV